MSVESKAEEALAAALAADPLEGWDLTRQYVFAPGRKWSFDFAFPSQKLAVECEGRRHRTFKGHRTDCEKSIDVARLGWRVMRFPSDQHRRATEWAALIRETLCSPPELPPSEEE